MVLRSIRHVLAKDRVDVVEMRLLGIGDEELLAVGVGPIVGHRHDASAVVLLAQLETG